MQLTETVTISEDVVARNVSGETVLLHLGSGTYYGLNEVGARVWELIEEEPRSLTALTDAIEAEFDVKREQAARDIQSVVVELESKGLVTRTN